MPLAMARPPRTHANSTATALDRPVRIQLFGLPKVQVDQTERNLEAKDALLLAWLAIAGPTPRARLGALLFPDADDAKARNSLRQRLFQLKRRLGIDLIVGDAVLQVAPGVRVAQDDDDELLAGVEAADLDEIGEWLALQREQRATHRADALANAAEQAEATGDLIAALEQARALVKLTPDSEHAHRRVMRLHYLRGDRAAALTAYEDCRQALRRRLHAAPSRETDALHAQIAAAVPAPAPAAQSGRVPLTVLRPPRLIGRDAEWQALNDTWSSAGAALLVGEGGLGKSRLLQDIAQARGRALNVSARPGDEHVPYAVLSRLLRRLTEARPPQPSVARELARLLPELGESEPMIDDEGRARFANAVDAFVTSAAGDVDAVLLDDLQFADAASCEALLRIAAASDRPWIVAMRSAELEPSALKLVHALIDERAATRIELRPLTEAQVLDLVTSLGIDTGALGLPEFARALYRRAGGNPLYTLETIRTLLAAGAEPSLAGAGGGALPALRQVGAVIGRRIERLSADAVRLARCAAVAGQDFSIALAARVLGARPLDLADAWNELESAQVFRDGGFAHDLIFEAALASVPAPIARELHREIAGLLEAEAPPATVAGHWQAAGDHARAGASYMAAAQTARAASRRAEEASFLDSASACFASSGDTHAEFEALVQLTNALTWVDAGQRQQAALDRMLAIASTPEQRLHALTEACYSESNRGNRQRSIELAREALALAESIGNRDAAHKITGTLAIGLVYLGRHDEALAVFESQRAWVEAHGSARERRDFDADRSWPLLALNRLDEAHEALNRAVGIARELGELADLNATLSLKAAAHARGGEIEAAIEAYRQAIALHGVLGSAAGVPMLDRAANAWLLVHLGRYREALDDYDAALAAFDTAGLLLQARRVRAMRALAYLQLGQTARARQTLPAYTSDSDISPLDHLVLGLIERAAPGARALRAEEHFRRADPSPRMASTAMSLAEVALVYRIESMAPAAARSAAADLATLARRRGQNGVAIAALAQLARASAVCGERGAVRDAARDALALMERFHPEVVYRGDVWLALATALRTIDDDDAAARIEMAAAQWIETTAREHVPDAFRDSFLERNPANRSLRQAAARLRRSERR